MRNRTSVMEGRLSGLDLAEVLQVVGLSRQFTAVELTDTEGGTVGAILLKSGKVLRVESRDGQDRSSAAVRNHLPTLGGVSAGRADGAAVEHGPQGPADRSAQKPGTPGCP